MNISNPVERNTRNTLVLYKIKIGLIYLSFHGYPVCSSTSGSLILMGAHFTVLCNHALSPCSVPSSVLKVDTAVNVVFQ